MLVNTLECNVDIIFLTSVRGVSPRTVFVEPEETKLWQIVVERDAVIAIDETSGKNVSYGAPKIAFDLVERIEPMRDGTAPTVLIPINKTLTPGEYLLRLRNSRSGELAIW